MSGFSSIESQFYHKAISTKSLGKETGVVRFMLQLCPSRECLFQVS